MSASHSSCLQKQMKIELQVKKLYCMRNYGQIMNRTYGQFKILATLGHTMNRTYGQIII